MARIGVNPAKMVQGVIHPSKVAVVTMVYVPTLSGYWEQSLQVLDLFFTSMRTNTAVPYELYVLDNGSCSTVSQYLEDLYGRGYIKYLIKTNTNVGKVGGWNMLFGCCQSEIICYADSDIYFFNDYLRKGIEILEVFPEAGMVTCQPIAGGDLRCARASREAALCDDISVHVGNLIPEDIVRRQVYALGRGEEEMFRRSIDRHDVLLERSGVKAYANSSHFQFLTRKAVVEKLFPVVANVPLGGDDQFEESNPAMTWWRLCTADYLVHHLGNDANGWIIDGTAEEEEHHASKEGTGFIRSSHTLRNIIKRIHLATYKYLYK